MKKVARKVFPLSLFILILSTVSCDNDADLIADYVFLDDINATISDDYTANNPIKTTFEPTVIQEESSTDN
ncbi:MAG: hypothetical protein QM485_12435 [Flavobacteriaceae bacterium]